MLEIELSIEVALHVSPMDLEFQVVPRAGGVALHGFALLVWPNAAFNPSASLIGSSFAQKCM